MGYPHRHNEVFEFLKANPGQQFTGTQIAAALKWSPEGNPSQVLHTVLKNHHTVVTKVMLGKKAFAAKYVGRAQALPPPKQLPSADVLVTIPFGANRSETMTLAAARSLYVQLRGMFGGG